MLAVTANWLLTDGSLAPAHGAEAAGWLHAIRRAVIRAGFRRDGRYDPVESATLVFAGDTFDWLLSDTWSGRERPWHGGPRSREARAKVAAASLQAARPVLAGLRGWIRRGIPVPAGDAHGRPSARGVFHVPLQVAMLSGDRDAWAGETFVSHDDSLRRLGVWVGDSWADSDVTIRHGHDRDPVTHAGAASTVPGHPRTPSLAESLTVDLVVPFAMAIKAETALWHLVRPRLGTIAAAGIADVPQSVARLVGLWGGASPPGRRVLMLWRRAVMAWEQATRREPLVTETHHDVAGPVADWLEASVAHPGLALPHALAALSMTRSDAEEQGTILGHPSVNGACTSRGPWLRIMKPTRSIEELGQVASGPPVVTIGAAGGRRIVEAA